MALCDTKSKKWKRKKLLKYMEWRDVYASGSNTGTICYINNNKDMENNGIYLTDMGTKFIGYDII